MRLIWVFYNSPRGVMQGWPIFDLFQVWDEMFRQELSAVYTAAYNEEGLSAATEDAEDEDLPAAAEVSIDEDLPAATEDAVDEELSDEHPLFRKPSTEWLVEIQTAMKNEDEELIDSDVSTDTDSSEEEEP